MTPSNPQRPRGLKVALPEQGWFRIERAARFLDLSVRTLDRMARQKRITFYKKGPRGYRYTTKRHIYTARILTIGHAARLLGYRYEDVRRIFRSSMRAERSRHREWYKHHRFYVSLNSVLTLLRQRPSRGRIMVHRSSLRKLRQDAYAQGYQEGIRRARLGLRPTARPGPSAIRR